MIFVFRVTLNNTFLSLGVFSSLYCFPSSVYINSIFLSYEYQLGG